jgi:hypothetical protein
MGKYFTDIANEKFANASGLIHYFQLYNAFEKETNRDKKEKLLNDALTCYNGLSEKNKNKLKSYVPVEPLFLTYLVQNDNLEDFEAYLRKFKMAKEENPKDYYHYIHYLLNAFIERGKFPEYAEKMALDWLEYNRQKYADAARGKTSFPTDNNNIKRIKIEGAGRSVGQLTDACARVYQQQENGKKHCPIPVKA